MAKGANSKQLVLDKIQEVYPQAFIYGKELRIPFEEDGERVEIKVALTCAKTNVGGDDVQSGPDQQPPLDFTDKVAAPTEEEKQNISDLMAKLGL